MIIELDDGTYVTVEPAPPEPDGDDYAEQERLDALYVHEDEVHGGGECDCPVPVSLVKAGAVWYGEIPF